MKQIKKYILFTTKIAAGSCISIIIAQKLQLNFESSAGIITLLTILNTKWATMRLALNRILSFGVLVIIAWFTFSHLDNKWLSYSIFIFLLVSSSCLAKWRDTISVNAVIGTHFMTTHDFGITAIRNELYLVLTSSRKSPLFKRKER